MTAVCKRCGKDVEHKPIPMELRDQSGVYVVVARKGNVLFAPLFNKVLIKSESMYKYGDLS